MSISRTYQGRVSGAHFISGKTFVRIESLDEDTWKFHLNEHLSIYQDAINYYLVCFAACARGSKIESLVNLVSRVRDGWLTHEYRQAGKKSGFLVSLNRRVPLHFPPLMTFEDVSEILIEQNSSPEILNLALEALLTDLGGESSIQQGGRSYLPYFCSPGTKANFPRSPQLLERDQAKANLPIFLQTSESPEGICEKFDLQHFATLMKGQEPFTGTEIKKNLSEWLKHLVSEKLVTPDQQSLWQKEIDGMDEKGISLPRYHGASAKGVEKNRLYAFLLLKLLPPSAERLTVLKSTFPVPKADSGKSKALSKQQEEDAIREARLTSRKGDPIELARGERKYVFRSFSNLFCGASPNEGPIWTEFDIAAFKEALKTLNQIEQKTTERLADLAEFKSKIQFYLEKTGTAEDTEEPVTFHKDEQRLTLVAQLKEQLAKTLDDDFKSNGYRLRWATIKGWSSIRERFQKAVLKNPAITTENLIEKVVTAFQATTKNVGSVTLFRILAEPEFRAIWEEVPDNRITEWATNQWSQDLLTDVVKFDQLQNDHDDLERNLHIKLTPAHLQFSRRPIMLSDLGGASKVVHIERTQLREVNGKIEKIIIPSIITSIYWMNPATACYEERRIELTYSAPRLKRDSIAGNENRSLHQPLLQGLGFQLPELKTISEKSKPLAAALMPDWTGSSTRLRDPAPDRYLLNFPATLETDWIAEKVGALSRWKWQFNGPADEPLHLHWPETTKDKDSSNAWSNNKEIQEHGFTLAAYDLGIRTAAAYAIYHVVSSYEKVPANKRRFARFVGEAAGFKWYAYPHQRGTLRLPGEDQNELRPVSKEDRSIKRMREIYGKRGCPASPSETILFVRETESLTPYLADWLVDEIEVYRNPVETAYLKDQNELSLKVARQIQGYLRSSHRLLIDLREKGTLTDEDKKSIHSRHLALLNDHSSDPVAILIQHVHEIRKLLGKFLEFSANRILPLRQSIWKIEKQVPIKVTGEDQEPQDFIPFGLIELHLPIGTASQKIRGQGGLSLGRIEQIEDLRKRLLSYQREMNREIGKQMKIGFGRHSGSIPDAAPQMLRKLDELKDQRVKQTAHMILARSLNLRLKDDKKPREKREDYIHGEYEPIGQLPSNRPTVDFIVIEDLNRYRAEQGKSRAENRQLMQWSHRAIALTLRELAEPYGLSILATAASFSSKFCSITGRPGFRAEDVSQKRLYLINSWKKSSDSRRKSIAEQMITIFDKHPDKKELSFILPSQGGKMFVPGIAPHEMRDEFPIQQADLNASQNLALRAIASPSRLDLIHKIRAVSKSDKLTLRWDNLREKTYLDPKSEILPKVIGKPISKEVRSKKYSNFFFMGRGDEVQLPVKFDEAVCELPSGEKLQICSNYGLWTTFKDTIELENTIKINNSRLASLGLHDRLILSPVSISAVEDFHEEEDPEDDISM